MEFVRTGTRIEISDIKWDADAETIKANELPTEIAVTLGEELCSGMPEGNCLDEEELYDLIADYLSDEYGFCHEGFSFFCCN